MTFLTSSGRYEPAELDYEAMTLLAIEDPSKVAEYSISDAVATYFLHQKYVNTFVFSLCSIIPMTPDEILMKGSGGLREALLMAKASKANVIYPNKKVHDRDSFYTPSNTKREHLISEESYAGAECGAFECGVFRSDFEYTFELDQDACQRRIDNLDCDLEFALGEQGVEKTKVVNYTDVKQRITSGLQALKSDNRRTEKPLIYHYDVSAMYPNIILTNRIQPAAVVTLDTCAKCVFNDSEFEPSCQRRMEWQHQGKHLSATKHVLKRIEANSEVYDPNFKSLNKEEKSEYIMDHGKKASRRAHGKVHSVIQDTRKEIVCQRENSFYVDTVREFRDHRYQFKDKCKRAKCELSDAKQAGSDPATISRLEDQVLLYDSLQLAHKCILNSFYRYVARK